MLRSKSAIVCRKRAGRKSHALMLSHLAGVASLAITGSLASPAWAGSYTAGDETSLNTALSTAVGDGAANSTITLTNNVTLTTLNLPAPGKPITIDTGAFTLSRTYANSTTTGVLTLTGPYPSGAYTFNGAILGSDAGAGGNGTGRIGIYMTAQAVAINYGTITGGAGGGLGGAGGSGVVLTNTSTLTNYGTITGGSSPNTINGGGVGAFVQRGSTVTNYGTIQGGNGQTFGGSGVDFGPPTGGAANLINYGIVRGGTGTANIGGVGVNIRNGAGPIVNTGTIEGGNNNAAIWDNSAPAVTVINSGTLRAGAGHANAIEFAPLQSASTLTLELQKGSVIQGNVAANSGVTNIFRLGGDTDASFDVSAIGPQYQNFTVFQKNGNSTWTLTGTGSVATPWTISAGTLQIGNGATNGGILGDVTDNATLAFANSGSTTYAGAISGTGTVVQAGSGTTIVTGANSYSGGTFLNAGVLSVASDANLGDATGVLNFNGGILQVTGTAMTSTLRTITWGANGGGFDIADASNRFTVGQTLAGGGPLTKRGAGSLVLTADNSYSGGTTITAGILQLGNGGITGSITGDVADNGVLAFNHSNAVTFGGVIAGSGAVSQAGSGTTILSGVNSYAGGTTITAGTLIGSASGFGGGAITDNAALVINQLTDATFANAINGSGSFTKQGAGRLNVTGTGSLSGATTVAAGTLAVNGSLANSAITVQSGASLGGNGTVGATIIQSGGSIAPGNSIGTLHINGAFTQNAGSVYQVEVDPGSNAADRIAVNGTATIQSGAGLNVTQNPAGQYQVGTVYTVLTASGGVTGTYGLSGQTTSASAFLGLKDSYDKNNVYLTVIETRDPATAATTPNQSATAQGVDSLPVTNPVATAVLNSSSDAGARAAFDQLSGQVQASAQGALLANGLYVRDVAFDRLRDVVCVPTDPSARDRCEGKKLSIWEQGFGGWGGIAGNGNAAGLNHSAAGFLVGADVPVDDWRLGFFGGYSHSDFGLVSGGAAGDSNDYHLGAYAGTLLGDVALRLGASYTWSGITTDRAVAIGSFNDALHGIYNAGTTQVFGELGYGMAMDKLSLEPFANLTYVGLTTSTFTEAGGPAALTVRGNTTENMIATLGLRPSTDMDVAGLAGTLRGMLGWRHTFGTVTPDAQVSFAGGNVFGVSGVPTARDAAALEAGLDVMVIEGFVLGLTYGGQFSSRTTDQTARGTIRVSF